MAQWPEIFAQNPFTPTNALGTFTLFRLVSANQCLRRQQHVYICFLLRRQSLLAPAGFQYLPCVI